MTADATIDYDTLQQEALRGVVRTVLTRVAKSGLPGDHHLYISFDVRAPGVVLSKRLREKYPSEMTIVLQYRFWDLALTEERFEVKLTFDGIPERLVVPFAAIKVFIDPSVRYVLHFEDPQAVLDDDGPSPVDGDIVTARSNGGRSTATKRPRAPRPRTKAERESGASNLSAVQLPSPNPVSALPSPAPRSPLSAVPRGVESAPKAGEAVPASTAVETREETAHPTSGNPGAQVVSLDSFRKK